MNPILAYLVIAAACCITFVLGGLLNASRSKRHELKTKPTDPTE